MARPVNLEKLDTDIERVRNREEKRLIKLARKVGLFRWRISSEDLEAALYDLVETLDHPQFSQLETLTQKKARTMSATSKEERRKDTQRKVLLGAFIIAQMRHKPDLHAMLKPELEKFLDQHKKPEVIKLNKELLKDWL